MLHYKRGMGVLGSQRLSRANKKCQSCHRSFSTYFQSKKSERTHKYRTKSRWINMFERSVSWISGPETKSRRCTIPSAGWRQPLPSSFVTSATTAIPPQRCSLVLSSPWRILWKTETLIPALPFKRPQNTCAL